MNLTLPSDLVGLTSVRYDPATSPAEFGRSTRSSAAIETEGRRGPLEVLWWQLSLTSRSESEPSAVSLLRISRDRNGGLNVTGRAWQPHRTRRAGRSQPLNAIRRHPGPRRGDNEPWFRGTGEGARD